MTRMRSTRGRWGHMLAQVATVVACGLATPVGAATAQVGHRGYADIHLHQFAYLGFGGKAFVGVPYGPMAEALSSSLDRASHGPEHSRDWLGCGMAKRAALPCAILPPRSNSGYPTFEGWPDASEVTHQKVYFTWLERAVQGGLRLIVMFAVDGPVLCRWANDDGRNCDDEMGSIDRQLDAAYAMQQWVDSAHGGSGGGWYRIVTTPAEARAVIAQGKLAVVLGVETAHLFGCKATGPCEWDAALQHYWVRGVRHYFPIHQDDNAFGGASYFQKTLQRESNRPIWPWEYVIAPYSLNTKPCPQYAILRCNSLGLTQTGRAFIRELMHRGALVDVDHMSDRSFAETLTLATQLDYPVVASHAGFNGINAADQDHEGQLTLEEAGQIRTVHGMIGLITGQGELNDVNTWARGGRHEVLHACGRTTETFAQALLFADDQLPGLSLGIGSDFNAPLLQPGARFGPNKCPGGGAASSSPNMLSYPFDANGYFNQLGRMTIGQRLLDYNYDGLTNIGMLPDFFADLRALGLSEAETAPLLYAADSYLRMWERAVTRSITIPAASVAWEPLGRQAVLSSPGVSSPGAKRLEVFVRGTDQQLHTKWSDGAVWSNYDPLGTELITESPSAVSWGPNRTDVFVRGTDGKLYHKWWDGTIWSGYEVVSTKRISGSPAVSSSGIDKLEVFVRGTDDRLYTIWTDGAGWSNYDPLGTELITESPSAVSWGPNRTDVFVRGTDGRLYHKWWDGANWSGYEVLGSEKIASGPAVASSGVNRLEVFARGTDDHLYMKRWDGANWSGYEMVGAQTIAGTPSAVSSAPGRVDVFVRGTDGVVYHKWWDGRWWP